MFFLIQIEELLEKPEFKTFKWIGSGIQKHCGHITIAKQDVNGTIPTRKVTRLYEELVRIVNDFDPNGTTLTMRESDLDFKIYVKVELFHLESKALMFLFPGKTEGKNIQQGTWYPSCERETEA